MATAAAAEHEALLERLIGPYVKKNERKLDLSGGTMVIRGVELRPDVFDSLGLPVTVRGGEVPAGSSFRKQVITGGGSWM